MQVDPNSWKYSKETKDEHGDSESETGEQSV